MLAMRWSSGIRSQVGHDRPVTDPDLTWKSALQRFRDLAESDARRAYISLLESARSRWESGVTVHPWRLDSLDFRPRVRANLRLQVEYRVRDGEPIMIFTLGHGDGITPFPVISGDVTSLDGAPVVLDAFLLQLAEPEDIH
jgi:hypothetical protein